MSDDEKTPQIIEKNEKEVMKEQEAKLRSKYPNVKPGGSALLAKRLSKGSQKYFDSGDYNMAKARGGGKVGLLGKQQPRAMPATTAAAAQKQPSSPIDLGEDVVTGDEIPTPETVASRKHSVHLQSKLAAAGTPS